jgi:hydrogenase nickel incorporation protein HypA/HybF
MHELSLCGAVADIVARRAGERQVQSVQVRIGELRQVVPDTLSFCWSMITSDTDLDGCELQIERVPAVLRCNACSAEHEMAGRPAFACASCAGFDVSVIAGDEFLVTSLELMEV